MHSKPVQLLHRCQSFLKLHLSRFRVNRAYRMGRTRLTFGPTSLNMMMIDTCNSQCLMCGKDYRSCGSKSALSLQDVKSIFRHLHMNQVVDLIYGGGGEPFLNRDLSDIAEYTHTLFPAVQHTVISNFMDWQPSAVSRLLDSRVNFMISVNAATRETYRKISGVDAFERVVVNIGKLVEMKRRKKAQVGISLSMILMWQNIGELSKFIKISSELGVDDVKTLYVRIYPETYREKHDRGYLIQPDDSLFFHQQQADSEVMRATRLSKKLRIGFGHEPMFSCSRTCERDCTEPWKSLFINFNGDVYPCPASEILFKPKMDSGQYKSGNIIKQSIEEIWNNPFWRSIRKTNISGGNRHLIPECSCCGNAINWDGPGVEKAHILDWKKAQSSKFAI